MEGAGRLAIDLDERARDRLAAYAALAVKWGRITNLSGATTAAGFIADHLLDCLAVVPHLPTGQVVDVGSGAGLPGIVIAVMRPAASVTLLEPRARRARFLTQCAIELELDGVEIVAARVEDYTPATAPAVIVCRAFAPLPKVVSVTAHLCDAATRLVVMQAEPAAPELAAAARAGGPYEVIRLDVPGFARRALVVLRPGAGDATGAGAR